MFPYVESNRNSTNRELYTWDYHNRLTSVTQQEFNAETQEWTTVQIVEYTYDYNNVWIRKIIGNEKTIFIPENYQTTVQIDNNTVSHHYLWTPGQQDKLLAGVTANNVLWSLTDHLGTVRDIIGNSTTHLIYDAFGNLTSGTTPILFAYTGKAFDVSTQLQNNINRWYDSTVGRWLSTDPIGFEGNDTNLYRYVGNQTVVYMDSEGLKKRAIVIIWNDRNPFTFSDIAYSGSFLNVARYYENLKGTHGKKVFMLPMGNDGLNVICNIEDIYCIEELIIIDHGNLNGSQLVQGQKMEELGHILQTLSDMLCDSTNIPIRIKLLGCGAGKITSPSEIPPTAQKLLDICTITSEGKPRRVQIEAYPGIVDTFDSPIPRKEKARGLKRFPNPRKSSRK